MKQVDQARALWAQLEGGKEQFVVWFQQYRIRTSPVSVNHENLYEYETREKTDEYQLRSFVGSWNGSKGAI